MTVEYGEGECWSAAITAVICTIASTFANEVRGNKWLSLFADYKWVRDQGARHITETFCPNHKGKPNDAIRAFVRVANNFVVTRDDLKIADLVGFGNKRPAGDRAIAGLCFSRAAGAQVGHWSAVVRREGRWRLIDGSVNRAASDADLASACYWIFRTKARRDGGAASAQQLVATKKPPAAEPAAPQIRVLGRPQDPALALLDDALCLACGKRASQHGDDKGRFVCGVCATTAIGACANVVPEHRAAYERPGKWFCASCVARHKAPGGGNRARHSRAKPYAPAATPASVLLAALARDDGTATAPGPNIEMRTAQSTSTSNVAARQFPSAAPEAAATSIAVSSPTPAPAAQASATTTWAPTPGHNAIGIHNMGNTCYLAAALNAIAHVPRIANEARRRMTTSPTYPSRSLGAMTAQALTAMQNSRGLYTPTSLVSYATTNLDWQLHTQHDAADFMLKLLDPIDGPSLPLTGLHAEETATCSSRELRRATNEALRAARAKSPQTAAHVTALEKFSKSIGTKDCPYAETDGVVELSRKKATTSPIVVPLPPSVPSPRSVKLSKLIATQLSAPTETHFYVYAADGAPAIQVEARSASTITAAPPVIIFQLGRGERDGNTLRKNRTRVLIEPIIDISSQLPSGTEKAHGVYHVDAVIAHSGASLDGGHYGALVAGADGGATMQFCDDAHVTPMTLKEFFANEQWDPVVVIYSRSTFTTPTSPRPDAPDAPHAVAEHIAPPLPKSRSPPPAQQPPPPYDAAAAQTAAPSDHFAFDQCGAVFRCSQVPRPHLAALKGDAFMNLPLHPIESLPSKNTVHAFRQHHPFTLAPQQWLSGKTIEVRRRHLQALHMVKTALMETRFAQTPLANAIVTVLRERARARYWKASTLVREMGNLAGAISDLPLYSRSPIGFKLGEAAHFAEAMRSAEQLANAEMIGSQPAATIEEMLSAVAWAPDVATKVALALTWCTAGRVGDVLKLQRQNIKLDADFLTNGRTHLTFSRGKGAQLVQPYTVPTICIEEWRTLVHRFMQGMMPTEWVFPGGTKTFGPLTNAALRTVNPEYTVRAIRRGALQAMAAAGETDATLMLFSGHKSVDTLHRYLNWGAASAARTTDAFAAAQNLAPQQPPASQH